MNYESGFNAGEHQAFQDRRSGVVRDLGDAPQSEWQRGYRDGYTPRSPTWARSLARIACWETT
ncbi:hypothetical protein [Methylibium sp.]|uniref:hypothetical protein n=1 Tax=Methylibium sp. TaxID=2067992 RepID=UPI0017CD298C|nr:hypothetical protein [Methylibium sp.]MBA3590354.1 hypothetical protein [Methylibium sp.]